LNPSLRRAFAGRSVLVTGHTGFKGSWLCLWLSRLGARVAGYALPPNVKAGTYEVCAVEALLAASTLADIRDEERFEAALHAADPDVVFHLAAQPLVRESYAEPRHTFDVNAMGTVTVLESVRRRARPCVVVVVTSDKCYAQDRGAARDAEQARRAENARDAEGVGDRQDIRHAEDDPRAEDARHSQDARHSEGDRLGGHDPYSASKAVAELIAASYRSSFFPPDRLERHQISLATARAGNVIGGGDRSPDRIVVDVLEALCSGKPVELRNPLAVRPWQHVLEPVGGYLDLAARLLTRPEPSLCGAFNFGPLAEDERPVRDLVALLHEAWGDGAVIESAPTDAPYESPVLRLSIEKARDRLGWTPRWRLARAAEHTVAWQRAFLSERVDMREFSLQQIESFEATPHLSDPVTDGEAVTVGDAATISAGARDASAEEVGG